MLTGAVCNQLPHSCPLPGICCQLPFQPSHSQCFPYLEQVSHRAGMQWRGRHFTLCDLYWCKVTPSVSHLTVFLYGRVSSLAVVTWQSELVLKSRGMCCTFLSKRLPHWMTHTTALRWRSGLLWGRCSPLTVESGVKLQFPGLAANTYPLSHLTDPFAHF